MTPEQKAELPSLQYKLVCKDAFGRLIAEQAIIVQKLDLIIERQAEVKTDLATTKEIANEVYSSLIMGNGDSIITQVSKHGEAIEELKNNSAKAGNRLWDFAKLLIAATLPLLVLWITHQL